MVNIIWKGRVLFFYFLVSLFTISFFLISVLPMKAARGNYKIKYFFAFVFSWIFVKLAEIICGLKYKVRGLEKLPSRPCLVLANHQSFWDNVFMQIIIPRHSWIIKKELFDIPFFGWGLRAVDPIAVDRSDNISVKKILTEGKKKFARGLWIVMFPESTRLRPEQKTRFKPSAAKLASGARVPIVLVAHNAGVFWPKGFWVKKPGRIEVNIVDVLYEGEIAEPDVRELTDKIENIINEEKEILFRKTLKAR